MTVAEERAQLRVELLVVQVRIDNAYWLFTHTKRGKPPLLVVPDAYVRQREITERLVELRRMERT